MRLYSIASTRYGDYFDGKTATLCVRRALYYDPETGKEDPAKMGVCSNFLCDSKPGDKVQIAGKFRLILDKVSTSPVDLVMFFVTLVSEDIVSLFRKERFEICIN